MSGSECLCATSGEPLVKPAGVSRLHTPPVRALCRTVHIKQPRLEEASRADRTDFWLHGAGSRVQMLQRRSIQLPLEGGGMHCARHGCHRRYAVQE